MSMLHPHHSTSQDTIILKSLDVFDNLFSEAPIKPFAIKLWNGYEWQSHDGEPGFVLELKQPSALRSLLWRPNELTLGEAFIYDEFEVHGDLEGSFELADYLMDRRWRMTEKLRIAQKILRLTGKHANGNSHQTTRLKGRAHTKERDAQAVRYHYNVSNDFYKLWLDDRMIYSCAFFHNDDESLNTAQERKLDYICRKLRLKPGERLLDIGCGWGGLIMHAAQHYGVEALGITLSEAQAELAKERIEEAGLKDRCNVEICDYREVPLDRPFDKLVSVGMVEHVGEKKLPDYFGQAFSLLKPGGVFLNHGITESALGHNKKNGPSFIDKYVFPDGELSPISRVLIPAEEAGFEVRDVESLREHYAMTLRHWVDRLERQKDLAIALTSPETYRIWRIYMAGSAYGFETNRIGLYQSLLVKSGRKASTLPLTRCDWYRPCPGGLH